MAIKADPFQSVTQSTAEDHRYELSAEVMPDYAAIGRRKLLEIDGDAGEKVEGALNDICPDLARYQIAYSFGEIYAREILDNRTKEQAVVAALTAMGTAAPQLKVHIHAALHVGCTPEEIREIIIQMSRTQDSLRR